MKETIALNSKEQKRLMILNKILEGQLSAQQGGELMGLGVRQVRRMIAAYREQGAAALSHGNRGRAPSNALTDEVRERIVKLARTKYAGCNQQHMSELLAEREGIHICRSTLRNTLSQHGVVSKRSRRPPKHRCRRERYPQEGQLWQIDASPHDWLQGRGPRLVLLACIDDATGWVPCAVFREQEDAHGYMLLMKQGVLAHGRPLAVYHDRHSIFEQTPRRMVDWNCEEQLLGELGEREPTQFGRVLRELEIRSIAAHSPQAKGRVERLFGTLQDRLVSELRLAGASTQAEANMILREYLPRFNARFAVSAQAEGTSYRPLSVLNAECDLGMYADTIFCMKYVRTVGADNTVRFYGHRLQLLPSLQRMSYARVQVEVHERLDGSLAVYHKGECLAYQVAPLEATALRARGAMRVKVGVGVTPSPAVCTPCTPSSFQKPVPNHHHPWRNYPTRR